MSEILELPACIEAGIGENERVVFFSDAHLGSGNDHDSRARTERVCAFLDSLPGRAEVLVILGDLFDFYFEFRNVVPARHLRVLACLEALTRSGVRCYYVAGNHDFWLGDLFTTTLGITVAPDGLLMERAGEGGCTVLAAHGDGLGEGDKGYKIFKTLLRNRALIAMFRLIHPDRGYALANLTSRTSRKHTSKRQDARIEASADVAHSLLDSNDKLDTVILSHTHHPDDRRFSSGRYLNTGDWCTHFSLVRWNNADNFEMDYFNEPGR